MRTANQKEINFINQFRARNPLVAEDVYVEPFLLINSEFIPKYAMFLHPRAVKQTAVQAGAKDYNGLNFKVMHSRNIVVSLGKSFAGAFDDKTNSSYVKFYFPKGFSENGYSVDDLVKGIDAGVYAETSFGFSAWPLKEKSLKCSLCGGNPLWFRSYLGGDGDWCGHEPGYDYPVTEAMLDFIKKLKAEGMDSYPGQVIKAGDKVEARMWMMDTENCLSELSLVDRGASDSKPVREDEIPVKFSEAREHPAFKLAASGEGATPSDIKALIKGTGFSIDIPFIKTSEFDDIDLPGGKKQQMIGGEKKLSLKKQIKEFFSNIQADLDKPDDAPPAQTIVVQSAQDTETLKAMQILLAGAGYDGKDLSVFLGGMKAHEADAKKYQGIPEALRTQIEATDISWNEVEDYVKLIQTEIETICTDYIAAAVAVKGNDAKPEALKEEIVLKVKAVGIGPAFEYARKMIETFKKTEPLKAGQQTDSRAPETTDEPDKTVKETMLRTMAKEAVAKFNKN